MESSHDRDLQDAAMRLEDVVTPHQPGPDPATIIAALLRAPIPMVPLALQAPPQ